MITCGGISEVGDRRASNQDSILYVHDIVEGHTVGLFAVADGMGGLSFGLEMSRYIVSELKRWWEMDMPQMIHSDCTKDEEIHELLDQEIWDINQSALKFVKQTGRQSGSTLAFLFLLDRRYFIKNLGDSRIYRFRKQKMEQLTVDQITCQPVKAGNRIVRYRSVLTMCVGMLESPVAYSTDGIVSTGDCFLLCSDGLYNCLETDNICSVLENTDLHPNDMALNIRKKIPVGQALDNVSVIIIKIGKIRK